MNTTNLTHDKRWKVRSTVFSSFLFSPLFFVRLCACRFLSTYLIEVIVVVQLNHDWSAQRVINLHWISSQCQGYHCHYLLVVIVIIIIIDLRSANLLVNTPQEYYWLFENVMTSFSILLVLVIIISFLVTLIIIIIISSGNVTTIIIIVTFIIIKTIIIIIIIIINNNNNITSWLFTLDVLLIRSFWGFLSSFIAIVLSSYQQRRQPWSPPLE